MNKEKLISKILENPVFDLQPPILIDIGASGEIFKKWALIAPYSICLAFDADDREFDISTIENSGFKKLHKINRLIGIDDLDSVNFYLTKDPFCSSSLMPDYKSLNSWEFALQFEIEKCIQLPSVTLNTVLNKLKYTYIDWYKSDTQGTDLRLLKSLDNELLKTIIAIDLEPGILNAYLGEDKLFHILNYFEDIEFWVSSMKVINIRRVNNKYKNLLSHIKSPGWAEITSLKNKCNESKRSNLLLLTFALIEDQFGFALELLEDLQNKDDDYKTLHTELSAIINKKHTRIIPFYIHFLFYLKSIAKRFFDHITRNFY